MLKGRLLTSVDDQTSYEEDVRRRLRGKSDQLRRGSRVIIRVRNLAGPRRTYIGREYFGHEYVAVVSSPVIKGEFMAAVKLSSSGKVVNLRLIVRDGMLYSGFVAGREATSGVTERGAFVRFAAYPAQQPASYGYILLKESAATGSSLAAVA